MKIKYAVNRIIALFAGILLLTGVLTSAVFAKPIMDLTKGTLTIKTISQNGSLKNYTFNMYKIVDISKDSEGKLTFKSGQGYETALSGISDLSDMSLLQERMTAISEVVNKKSPHKTTNKIEADIAEYQIKDIDVGYYVVRVLTPEGGTKTSDFLVSVPSTQPNGSDLLYDQEVNVKTGTVSISKTAQAEQSGSTGSGTERSIMIGDIVDYTLHLKVPDTTGYVKYTYTINDTMSKGLQFVEDSLKVMMGDTELVKDRDYTYTATKEEESGKTFLTLEFDKGLFVDADTQQNPAEYPAGEELKVTYKASITMDALEDPKAGITNDAKLIYSNDPGSDGEGVTKDETPIAEKTKFYTFNICLTKKFDPESEDFSNVRFDFEGISLKKLEDGKYMPDLTAEDKNTGNKDLELAEDGTLTIVGLKSGKYYFSEVRTAAGYNLLNSKARVIISPEYNSQGALTGYKYATNAADATNTVQIEVLNKKGYVLPATGGTGMTASVAAGICLIAIMAVTAVVYGKKHRNE